MNEDHLQENLNPQRPLFDARRHVRMRPGMYLGNTDKKALHAMVETLIYDAVEECQSGRGNHIWITLKEANEIVIKDNGAGIPIDIEVSSGRSFLEHYLTRNLHNARRKNGGYGLAHGSFEIGISFVSALCKGFRVEIKRDGYLWQQSYDEGLPTSDVLQIRSLSEQEETGTTITLTPDFSIFESNEFDYEFLRERACDIAYSVSNLTVTLFDERAYPFKIEGFKFPSGMADLVKTLNEGQQVLHEIIHYKGVSITRTKQRQENFDVEFALQYNNSRNTVVKTYVNTLPISQGTHIIGLQSAIVDIINTKVAKPIRTLFNWKTVREGLTIAINLKLPDPSWENQTKMNLLNSHAYGAVADIVYSGMDQANTVIYPQTTSDTFNAIIAKCWQNRKKTKKQN
jgi:DNA gyrase subunit B